MGKSINRSTKCNIKGQDYLEKNFCQSIFKQTRVTRVLHFISGDMVQSQSEHIVSYEPGLTLRLQDKALKEPDRRVIVSLS